MSHDPSGLFKPYRSWLNPGLCLESWNFPPSFLGFSSSCSGTPHATVRMGGGCATNRKNNTEQYIFIVLLQYSLWIQPYLLRKWDWGMIWGVGRTFLDSGHGSIRMYHKPYSAILINQCSQLIMEHHRVSPMRLGKSTNPMMGFSHFGGPLGFLV